MGAHEADQLAVIEPHQPGFFVVNNVGGVIGEGRVIFPVPAAIIRADQERPRAFAFAFLFVAMHAAIEAHQKPAIGQLPAAEPTARMLHRPNIAGHRLVTPGFAAVVTEHHIGADPGPQPIGPGPVAPFLRLRTRGPGRLLVLHPALEEGGDGEVHDQRAIGHLADAAVPVPLNVRPGINHLVVRPGPAAVFRPGDHRLPGIVVDGKAFLVEDGQDVAVP